MTDAFTPHMRPPAPDDREPIYVPVQDGEVLLEQSGESEEVSFPDAPVAGTQHVLGSSGERPVIAVDANGSSGTLTPIGLRELYGMVPDSDWSIASRAVQIVAWDRDHRFCGRCATETVPEATERERRCPNCGLAVYPRLSPAVIVLVTRGAHDEEVLLAWGRRRQLRAYSVLAGFVEVGEDLEQAVRREVSEETGVHVRDVTYFGSQPWPFPGQLMVGFRARYDRGEIEVQRTEIVEARWFTASEVEQVSTPRGHFSIAGWLIDSWLAEQHARRG